MLVRYGLGGAFLLVNCEHVGFRVLNIFVEGARVCTVRERGAFIPL